MAVPAYVIKKQPMYPNSCKTRGEMLIAQSMKDYTSWRVGGPADRVYLPADLEDLIEFLQTLPSVEPLAWLGLGSNLLVRDGGIRGTVICTKNRLKAMKLLDGGRIYVEAGVPCALAARFAGDQGLNGAEFLAGIPGTMGGALAMNAGAFGGETWPLVEKVISVDRFGNTHERLPADFQVGYRSVKGPVDEWFVATVLQLSPGDTSQSRDQIKALLAKRAATQPVSQPSCGSVFRNPPGDHAARLIESCGLKGFRIGGACVSEKHANFIVNLGDARAFEIETLIYRVKEEVSKQTGVDLIPEVRIVGEAAKQTPSGEIQ